MAFSSEKTLVDTFITKSRPFYRRVTGNEINRYYVLTEFDSGFGVADIVLGAFVPYLSIRQLRSSIDANWIGALIEFLGDDPFRLVDFADRCGVTIQTAKEKVNQFVAAGFLTIEQELYLKRKDYNFSNDTSIAIEAKIKNWKQALNQARRYKKFANYSYVLMDAQFSGPAEKNIHLFHQFNIGLASMKGHRQIIHYSPVYNEVPENLYTYKLNETVYQYFRSTYGCSG